MHKHSVSPADVKNRPGPFVESAEGLRANGYSPLPIRTDLKRPRGDGWSRYCATARTAAEIEAHALRHPYDGLGVCGGFGGLVAVDIDTDEPAVIDLVLSVLPPVRVARRGRKGLVAFFLAPPGTVVASKRLKGRDRRALVEILAGGRQAVVPPTMHPGTRRPYHWITGENLLSVPAAKLPVLHTAELESELRRVLGDFLLPPRVYPEKQRAFGNVEQLTASEHRRQLGRARAILRRWEAELSSIGEGGRNDSLFSASCAVGYSVWTGLIPREEIDAAMLRACQRNGFLRDEGRAGVLAVIENGLDYAEWDGLPVLDDRPYGVRP